MASAITESQIVGWAIEGKHTNQQAMEMAVRLGLDHTVVAKALGIQIPQTREEAEALEPPAWTVTARGIRAAGEGTPDGKEFPYVWAGSAPWSVAPEGSSTHTLTESQMVRVRAKASKGKLVIIKAERLRPPDDKQPAATQAHQNGKR